MKSELNPKSFLFIVHIPIAHSNTMIYFMYSYLMLCGPRCCLIYWFLINQYSYNEYRLPCQGRFLYPLKTNRSFCYSQLIRHLFVCCMIGIFRNAVLFKALLLLDYVWFFNFQQRRSLGWKNLIFFLSTSNCITDINMLHW